MIQLVIRICEHVILFVFVLLDKFVRSPITGVFDIFESNMHKYAG